MKVSDLIKELQRLPSDFQINFLFEERIGEEELEKMSYKWPYRNKQLKFGGFDVGHSSRVVNLFLDEEKKEEDCKSCQNFLGMGDWDLCCSEHHEGYPLGFLCYEDTKACEKFKRKEGEEEK